VTKLRIIKKYPNRRLYDTEISRYITLSDIRELVINCVNFQVVDAHTSDDITRSILLQIILEQESGGRPLFTTQVLSHMIRFYGDAVEGIFASYLEKSLGMFAEQQTRLREQLRSPLSSTPIDAMTEFTQRNIELWRDLQDHLFEVARNTGSQETEKH